MAEYPLYAYLSYRCKLARDIGARDKLRSICQDCGIELIYDEIETVEGDSLVTFMNDLTSARFVGVFLSEEYFKSAYTLYELIKINEWAEIEQRFVLPIRISPDMTTYQWTAAKTFFVENESIQNELKRLLRAQDQSSDDLWRRIDAAWTRLIFPYLDEKHADLTDVNSSDFLKDYVGQIKRLIQEAIHTETQSLEKTVVDKLTKILSRKQLRTALFREDENLDLQEHAAEQDIAKQLVNKEVGSALATLTRVLETHKPLMANDSNPWRAVCIDAEQMCGWLLLLSVEPAWWYHNQLGLTKSAENGINHQMLLDDPAFYEVIVSRRLRQNACYALSGKNKAKPAAETTDVMLFDAVTPDAQNEQLLQDLYRDLYRNLPANLTVDELRDGILRRARAQVKARNGKPLYYLVSRELMHAFVDCFTPVLDRLKGVLQFICCEKTGSLAKGKACREDQTDLLDQVAYLLSITNEA